MDRQVKLKIVILLVTVTATKNLIQNKHTSFKRIWIESHSGTIGWALKAGQCTTRPFLSTGHDRFQKWDCGHQPDLIQQQWSLAPGYQTAESRKDRSNEGLILSVINSRNGHLILHKVFPLWKYWAHWGDLQWHIERVEPGRLVVMSVSVTGTMGLRNATATLQQLGSLLAQHLTPRSHWSWVFIKGGRTISEAAILQTAADVHQHTQLLLSNLQSRHYYYDESLQALRWSYCETVGGMGGLCDEYNPSTLPIPCAPQLDKVASKIISSVPVIITAGNRQQYLYHTLTTLLAAHGSSKSNILVVLGNAPNSTTKLLELLNIKYTTLPVSDHTNTELYNFYRRVYHMVSDKYSDAPAAIFLDEDVEISMDFFSYMSQTLKILYKDPTLYCINGFSAYGGQGMISDPTKILRGSIQVEWGYALTLEFIREALSKWKIQGGNTLLYDFNLYVNIRGQRECIFPERSRARHYGMGVNTAVDLMELSNFNIKMVAEVPIKLQDVERVEIKWWRLQLSNKIKHALPILKNPCDPTFLPKPPHHANYVFYYRLDSLEEHRPDYYQYHHPNECLGLWASSEQGHHEGVTIVHFSPDAYLYLVGVPYSSYSYLKPTTVPLWDVDAISDEEFNIMVNYTSRKNENVVANLNITKEYVMKLLGIDL